MILQIIETNVIKQFLVQQMELTLEGMFRMMILMDTIKFMQIA